MKEQTYICVEKAGLDVRKNHKGVVDWGKSMLMPSSDQEGNTANTVGVLVATAKKIYYFPREEPAGWAMALRPFARGLVLQLVLGLIVTKFGYRPIDENAGALKEIKEVLGKGEGDVDALLEPLVKKYHDVYSLSRAGMTFKMSSGGRGPYSYSKEQALIVMTTVYDKDKRRALAEFLGA